MSDNLKIWNSVKQVPTNLLKPIQFGALKGKSDINPQWRMQAMTEQFGMVGHGWTYRIVRTWTENGNDGRVMCFAEVAVKTKYNGEWGEEFSGIGGSELIAKNKNGLQSNDEGYNMATTDALSVAFKCVGVAADIYLGNFDGSKYKNEVVQQPQAPQQAPSKDYISHEAFNKALEGKYTPEQVETKYILTPQQRKQLQENSK